MIANYLNNKGVTSRRGRETKWPSYLGLNQVIALSANMFQEVQDAD